MNAVNGLLINSNEPSSIQSQTGVSIPGPSLSGDVSINSDASSSNADTEANAGSLIARDHIIDITASNIDNNSIAGDIFMTTSSGPKNNQSTPADVLIYFG